MRLIAIVALGLALAGCGGATYGRPGATKEAFQRDAARCRMAMNGVAQTRSTPPPQAYNSQSVTSGRVTTTTTTPSPSTTVANNLSSTSDNLFDIAMRENIYENCLRAEGWVRVK